MGRSAYRRSIWVAVVVVALSLAGCDSSSSSGAGASGPSASEADHILRAANFTDRQFLRQLEALEFDTAAGDPAKALLSDSSPTVRLAAASVYTDAGGMDPAPLRPLFADKDAAVAVVAATGAVARGDAAGFDVLVRSLTDTDAIPGTTPQIAISTLATETLARQLAVTANGPPFDADAPRLAAAQVTWTQWLAANRSRLHWAQDTGWTVQ